MRLNIAFFTLLTIATIAVGIELLDFRAARQGGVLDRVVVFAGALVALVAIILLTRILVRVDAARRPGRGSL